MIRISVSYPRSPETHFDYDYYTSVHMPLAEERLKPFGLVNVEVTKGISGEPRPCFVVAYFTFATFRDYQKGISTYGDELSADIPKYTNVEPLVQVCEIAMTKSYA